MHTDRVMNVIVALMCRPVNVNWPTSLRRRQLPSS